MRPHIVPQPVKDPVDNAFADGIAALTHVWQDMVWLTTTNPRLIATRREIARWTRTTNQEFMDPFGRGIASEEIWVMLDGLVTLVPRQLGDGGRALLGRTGAEAQALAAEGRAAIDAI